MMSAPYVMDTERGRYARVTRTTLGDALREGVRRGDPQQIFHAWLCTSSGACRAALRERREEDGGKSLLALAIQARNVGVVYELLCATHRSSRATAAFAAVAVRRWSVMVPPLSSTSVLHIAATCHARAVMVDMLIEMCDVDVNCVDKDGNTPLQLAVRTSKRHDVTETVVALLKHGARVGAGGGGAPAPPARSWSWVSSRLDTLLAHALSTATATSVSRLLAAGARAPPCALHAMLGALNDLPCPTPECDVPQSVHDIVDVCDTLISGVLPSKRVSLIQRDGFGFTPFDLVLRLKHTPTRLRLLRMFVAKFYEDVHAACTRHGDSFLSVVLEHMASESLVRHLVRRGAHMDTSVSTHYLHVALARRCDARIVRMFLCWGGRMNDHRDRETYETHYERDPHSWLTAREWEFVNAQGADGSEVGPVSRCVRLILLRSVVDAPALLSNMMDTMRVSRDAVVGTSFNLARVGGCNALHVAVTTLATEHQSPTSAYTRDLDVRGIDTLLSWGVNVNAPNRMGHAPLHIAVRGGLVECVARLLRAGAKPNALASVDASCFRAHPLFMASQSVHPEELMSLLRAHGACMASCDAWRALSVDADMSVVSVFVDETCDAYTAAGTDADTHAAACKVATCGLHYLVARGVGCRALLQKMLRAGCSPDAVNEAGVPLLYVAVQGRHTAMVSTLLSAGASARAFTPSGDSALRCAGRTGVCDLVNMLIAAGAADTIPPR